MSCHICRWVCLFASLCVCLCVQESIFVSVLIWFESECVCFPECVKMSLYVLMCMSVYLCRHVVMLNSICQFDWAQGAQMFG